MFAGLMDNEQVTIKLSQLTEHLTCVLCRGMLRDAQTIPECLHSCECLLRIRVLSMGLMLLLLLQCWTAHGLIRS